MITKTLFLDAILLIHNFCNIFPYYIFSLQSVPPGDPAVEDLAEDQLPGFKQKFEKEVTEQPNKYCEALVTNTPG